MFDELDKYKSGHFFFQPGDKLEEVCNAPADKPGVFIVYTLARGKINMVYIGQTGENNSIAGLRDEIIKGKRFRGLAAGTYWPRKMKAEDIEALDVYWYATIDQKNKDRPEDVIRTILQIYINLYGNLPPWQK